MNEPRWLNSAQQRAWRTFLHASLGLMDALDADLRREHGLSLSDYEILAYLSEAPDCRLRMSDLAELVHVSRSHLTRQMDRLIELGLVERARCASDQRGVFGVLTAQGMERLRGAAPDHVESVRRYLIDRLSPQQIDVLAEVMGEIVHGLDAAPVSA